MSEREPYEVRFVDDRWRTLRDIVEIVALLGAGIWAFYTFIYQERIKPAGEPASLTLTVSVQSLGHDSVREIMEVSAILHNAGKTEIDVVADAYNVWGANYGAHPVVTKHELPNRREYNAGLPLLSRKLVSAFAELRDGAAGGQTGSHIVIEPGATETLSNVFAVPRGAYDLIHAQAIAVPVKTSLRTKIPVAIQYNRVGGYWLRPATTAGVDEDDNSTDFAIPH